MYINFIIFTVDRRANYSDDPKHLPLCWARSYERHIRYSQTEGDPDGRLEGYKDSHDGSTVGESRNENREKGRKTH